MSKIQSKIQNDKLIRETLIEETIGHKTFSSEIVITKEEFLACYNEWVLKPIIKEKGGAE